MTSTGAWSSVVTRWRSSSTVGLSAQWRSSMTSTTRCSRGDVGDRPGDRTEEEVALGFGVGRLAVGDLGQAGADLRDEPRQLAQVPLVDGRQRRLGGVGHEVGEGLDEGLVRHAEVVVGAAVQHGHPFLVGVLGEVARQRRLADSRARRTAARCAGPHPTPHPSTRRAAARARGLARPRPNLGRPASRPGSGSGRSGGRG